MFCGFNDSQLLILESVHVLLEIGGTAPSSLQFCCRAGFALASYVVLLSGWLHNSAPFIEFIMYLGAFKIRCAISM